MRRFLALGAVALLACKPAPPPPAPVEKPPTAPVMAEPAAPEPIALKEPNDYQHPQQIPSRAVVSSAIAGRAEHWFRVAPAPGTTLGVELAAQNAEIEISDRDRNQMLRTKAPALLPQVGCVESCFIKISDAAGPYTLTVLGGPPPPDQELEPNNRAVDANPLVPGKPMHGTLYDGDDQDWYKLPLPPPRPGQFLRVEISPLEGVRLLLEVRAIDDGALLASLQGRAPGEPLLVRDLSLSLGLRPATADGGVQASGYFLAVKSAKGANARAGYVLTATLEDGPTDLEQEPNDDMQHATPVGQSASGYLAPAGDQDWYRLHSDAPAVLHAELSGVPRTDLELWAVGADGGVLAGVNEGGTKEGETLPAVGLPAGDNFVVVRASGADPDNLYKISFTLFPDDGSIEREPNNDLATAQTLALPIEVKGFIWPRKDVDIFRFHVPADHAPVSVVVSAVRGVDLQLRLLEVHGEKSEVIGSSDHVRGEGEEKLLSVPLKEGDFAVEVSSPRNKDASATQPYLLSVK